MCRFERQTEGLQAFSQTRTIKSDTSYYGMIKKIIQSKA